jgi:hypothetical protein
MIGHGEVLNGAAALFTLPFKEGSWVVSLIVAATVRLKQDRIRKRRLVLLSKFREIPLS